MLSHARNSFDTLPPDVAPCVRQLAFLVSLAKQPQLLVFPCRAFPLTFVRAPQSHLQSHVRTATPIGVRLPAPSQITVRRPNLSPDKSSFFIPKDYHNHPHMNIVILVVLVLLLTGGGYVGGNTYLGNGYYGAGGGVGLVLFIVLILFLCGRL